MITSSNGNVFRVTDPLCGEFTVYRWIPIKMPVTRSFAVFFDLCLNKRLRRRWFGAPSHSLWRHCNFNTRNFEKCFVCFIVYDVHCLFWDEYPHFYIALSCLWVGVMVQGCRTIWLCTILFNILIDFIITLSPCSLFKSQINSFTPRYISSYSAPLQAAPAFSSVVFTANECTRARPRGTPKANAQ